jgi:hypothetical protein
MRQRTIGYFGSIALAMSSMGLAQEQTPVPEPPREQVAEPQSTEQQRNIRGEVVEVNAEMLAIRTDDGRRMTFSVDRDLTAGVEPIKVGSRVEVNYRGEQELEVVNVILLPLDNGLEDNGLEDNGVEATRVQTTPQTQPTAPPAAAQQDELPGTASPLPLVLAAGLALLGSGLGLSLRRRA